MLLCFVNECIVLLRRSTWIEIADKTLFQFDYVYNDRSIEDYWIWDIHAPFFVKIYLEMFLLVICTGLV